MRKLFIGCVAIIASMAMTSVASADTVTTHFEGYTVGSVDGQPLGGPSVWHSGGPGLPYDQAVVNSGGITGFGTQSLKLSNTFTSGEFHYQTYSPANQAMAGEGLTNTVFIGEFDVYGAQYEAGRFISVSPDNGYGTPGEEAGERMSYVGLADEAGGIRATFYDTDADGSFHAYDAGLYSYGAVHHVKFAIQFKTGADNDVVRFYIDGVDIGNRLGECFTTWENWYRVGEGETNPLPTGSMEFRSAGTAAPAGTPGYLFDNVVTTTAATGGPADTVCGKQAAFCSPGYWKNAPQAAWDKVAPIEKSSLFNDVVVPDFYARSIGQSVTLWNVLTGKSATKYGKAAGPYGLNPFNAVGAALTSALDGVDGHGLYFDPTMVGSISEYCPLDGNGEWKVPLTVSG